MNSEKVNDWLQIVGMVGIMASLIFVGLQVKQTQNIGEGESATNFIEAIAATRGLIAVNSEVWAKGCLGEELSIAERVEFVQVLRTYGQAQYFGWLAARNGILEVDGSEIVFSLAANTHRYPGFAKTFSSFKAWGVAASEFRHDSITEFSGLIATKVSELQTSDPSPNYDVSLCGL